MNTAQTEKKTKEQKIFDKIYKELDGLEGVSELTDKLVAVNKLIDLEVELDNTYLHAPIELTSIKSSYENVRTLETYKTILESRLQRLEY